MVKILPISTTRRTTAHRKLLRQRATSYQVENPVPGLGWAQNVTGLNPIIRYSTTIQI